MKRCRWDETMCAFHVIKGLYSRKHRNLRVELMICLFNETSANLASSYVYGPFGEVVRANGPMAGVNPFQFSTKYTDQETELDYYGYRYYNASAGRWISRDPQDENGGENLYGLVQNSPISFIDLIGLGTWHYNIDPGAIYYGGN